MKKLYFLMWIFVIAIAPILVITTSGTISWSILGFQWLILFILQFSMKKTRSEIFKPSRDSFFKSLFFNVFASDKEKELIEDTEWTRYVEVKLPTDNENLDNK